MLLPVECVVVASRHFAKTYHDLACFVGRDAAEYDLNRRFTEALGRNIPALLLTLGVSSSLQSGCIYCTSILESLLSLLLCPG